MGSQCSDRIMENIPDRKTIRLNKEGKVWQGSFYDHALRKDEDLLKVADYIVCNPVRKGIIQDWKDYPFSWHKWM